MKRTTIGLGILLVVGAVFPGCASRPTSFVREDVDYSFIQRAAVYPLQNRTPDPFADARVYSVVMSYLLDRGALRVIEEGQVYAAIRSLKLDTNQDPSSEQIVALGKELGVDAIVFGSVEDYGAEKLGGDRVNAVTLTLALAETQTGSLVWQSQVHRNGTSIWRKLFGGGSASLYDVTREAVDDAMETLF